MFATKPEPGSDTFLPLGDLLTTEDPVWVWDASAGRILWANHSGRLFWGADSLDTLRSKRFSPRSAIVSKLKSLANASNGARETTEDLILTSASGRVRAKCYLQGLQVAGGSRGFVVKILERNLDRPVTTENKNRSRKPAADDQQPRPVRDNADQQTLNAIAARLKADPASKAKKAAASDRKVTPEDMTGETDPFAIAIRELGHELGNPLNVIRGFAGWIKETAPPGRNHEKLKSYADSILESADLALAIFGNFSARYASHQAAPSTRAPADVRDVAESCLRLVAPLAKDSGVKLYRRIEGTLPRLSIGEDRLKQILLNLLINGIRYHKTGNQIKVTARKRKDNSVWLSVADNGKGMTKKEIRAVQKRSPSQTLAQTGHSGVGLPLVRRLVEDAGGELSIETKRGSGTKIGILFPEATLSGSD